MNLNYTFSVKFKYSNKIQYSNIHYYFHVDNYGNINDVFYAMRQPITRTHNFHSVLDLEITVI